MGMAAARVGDKILQPDPHCHAAIHPPAPVPTPYAHPAAPLMITHGNPTVCIGGIPAAALGSASQPCVLPGCTPGGPGVVVTGSMTVLIGGLPAARVGDRSLHHDCAVIIPATQGYILPPGCPTVLIGD